MTPAELMTDLRIPWMARELETISITDWSDQFLHDKGSMLATDALLACAHWFAIHFVDPRRYCSGFDYFDVYSDVLLALKSSDLTSLPGFKPKQLAGKLALFIFEQAEVLSESRTDRRRLDRREKELLLDLSGDPPRCWFTGFVFPQEAVDLYISGDGPAAPLPEFVDLLLPIGLNHRNLAIEIEHLVPFSRGGTDDPESNLKLSCGWANIGKSTHLSVFDVPTTPIVARSNGLGITTLPRPLWCLRMLTVKRQCEVPGCENNLANSSLTVRPINEKGAMVPTNLKLVCPDHDSLRSKYVKPRLLVERLWETAVR